MVTGGAPTGSSSSDDELRFVGYGIRVEIVWELVC